MRKTFKLNDRQSITIEFDHVLYSDILIASLANQNIDLIVRDTLLKMGYRRGIKYWYFKTEYGHFNDLYIIPID